MTDEGLGIRYVFQDSYFEPAVYPLVRRFERLERRLGWIRDGVERPGWSPLLDKEAEWIRAEEHATEILAAMNDVYHEIAAITGDVCEVQDIAWGDEWTLN